MDKAFEKFFDDVKAKRFGKKVHVGYPRFNMVDQYKSFTFPQVWMTVKDKKTGVTKRFEIVKSSGVSEAVGPVQPELVLEVKGNKRLWRQGPLPHQPHAVSPVVEAWKPRLKPHLSRG